MCGSWSSLSKQRTHNDDDTARRRWRRRRRRLRRLRRLTDRPFDARELGRSVRRHQRRRRRQHRRRRRLVASLRTAHQLEGGHLGERASLRDERLHHVRDAPGGGGRGGEGERDVTVEIMEFKAVSHEKKRKNYRTTAPPGGLVRNSRDHDRMMQYLCFFFPISTFTIAIFMRLDVIFTRYHTSLMP